MIREAEDGSGCWLWRGGSSHGYPRVLLDDDDVGSHNVRRIVWRLHRGRLPSGVVVVSECGNKRCVNPEHLRAMTRPEMARARLPMLAENAAVTHCPRGHEYTPKNTRLYRGRRYCRACQAERQRRRRQKAAAA